MSTQTRLTNEHRLRPVRSGYLPRGLSPRLAERPCKFAPETGCGVRLFGDSVIMFAAGTDNLDTVKKVGLNNL